MEFYENSMEIRNSRKKYTKRKHFWKNLNEFLKKLKNYTFLKDLKNLKFKSSQKTQNFKFLLFLKNFP